MRALTRLAAVAAAAAPLLLASAPAHADDITVPGCWGAVVYVCDVSVEYGELPGVERYTTLVPVCLGSCQYVPVTLYRVDADGELGPICVTYETNLVATPRCDTDNEAS